MKKSFISFCLLISSAVFAQKSYLDSTEAFLKNYVQTHEVVKGEDRKALQFYPVDKAYRVAAKFRRVMDSQWMQFRTSGKTPQVYKLFGTLVFNLHGQLLHLNVYQSQALLLNEQYKDYLFLPFTDSTGGNETYKGGRYIDLSVKDIRNGEAVIDFNKAYNPYCAYVSGVYNCPLPPKENALPVAIRAGEKAYRKAH